MIIETTVNPVRLICESRRLKALVLLSQTEFDFIASRRDLSAEEKIIWLALAAESAVSPELSCILSYQYLAARVGQDILSVYFTLLRLNRMGYIEVYNEERQGIAKVQLKLPLEGLLQCKLSPKIRDFKDKDYIQQLRAEKNPFLPNALQTFPV